MATTAATDPDKNRHYLVGNVISCDKDAENLKKAVASLDFCDLVIISFNGSKNIFDELKDYFATNLKIRIFHSVFLNFAWARNTIHSYMSQNEIEADWILWIDSDDICSDKLRKTAKTLIKRIEGLSTEQNPVTKIALEIENNAAKETFTQVRIYRPGAKWEGNIHEQVVIEGDTAKLMGAKITHYGYDDPEEVKAKRERNRKLLEQSIREKGLNPADCIAMGRMELMDGQAGDALKWLFASTCFDLENEDTEAIKMYIGQSYENFGKKDMAIEYYENSTHPDALFFLGRLKEDLVTLSKYVLKGQMPNRYGTQYALFSQIAKEIILKEE
jgi:hypothetical protein